MWAFCEAFGFIFSQHRYLRGANKKDGRCMRDSQIVVSSGQMEDKHRGVFSELTEQIVLSGREKRPDNDRKDSSAHSASCGSAEEPQLRMLSASSYSF